LSKEESSRDTTLHDRASDSSNGTPAAGVVATQETDLNQNQSTTQSNEEVASRPRANTGEEDYAKAREELLFL